MWYVMPSVSTSHDLNQALTLFNIIYIYVLDRPIDIELKLNFVHDVIDL